jgi:hypothetical protein
MTTGYVGHQTSDQSGENAQAYVRDADLFRDMLAPGCCRRWSRCSPLFAFLACLGIRAGRASHIGHDPRKLATG